MKTPLAVVLLLTLATLLFPIVAGYAPRQGDSFSYYETQKLGSGTGDYAGYSEQNIVNGTERVNGVDGNGIVSASYSYVWSWSNSTGNTETGTRLGNYIFSSTTFLYVNGTDDQNGYVNPTVWFAMDGSIPDGGTFNLLNTEMTVTSSNYSYYLPSQNRNVQAISTHGLSSYQRNDQYGTFTAAYTWNAYFDPSTGYIIGYDYVEQDTNPSGDGFTYTDNLYVTSTSYQLTGAAATSSTQNTTNINITDFASSIYTQYAGYIAVAALILIALSILIYASSRRRATLPQHPYHQEAPPIHLTPEQPQQIVIKEVVRVNCRYCAELIDSTARECPRCGAPRT